VFGGTKEVSAIFAELRVAKREKLIMAIANPNAVVECTVNTGINLIISLLVRRRIDSSLE
jgi:hypothetical protein